MSKSTKVLPEGCVVEWTSQAGGNTKTKRGPIVGVIPAGEAPDRELFAQLHRGSGCGMPRDHVSYVVKIGSKLYWPRVSALRAVWGSS
jgi:hypothetical protein